MIYVVFPQEAISLLEEELKKKVQVTPEGLAYVVALGAGTPTQERYHDLFVKEGVPFNMAAYYANTNVPFSAAAVRFNHDGTLNVFPKWIVDDVAYAVWHTRLEAMEMREVTEMQLIYALSGPEFGEHQLEYGKRYKLYQTLTD